MERNRMTFHLASRFFFSFFFLCRWLLGVQHMREKHVEKKKRTLQINDWSWKELAVQISGGAGISFQGKDLVMSWLQARHYFSETSLYLEWQCPQYHNQRWEQKTFAFLSSHLTTYTHIDLDSIDWLRKLLVITWSLKSSNSGKIPA